jgi:hypothetical protein
MAVLLWEDGRIIEDTGGLVPRLIAAMHTLVTDGEQQQNALAQYMTDARALLADMEGWLTLPPPSPEEMAVATRLQAETPQVRTLAAQVRQLNHPTEETARDE